MISIVVALAVVWVTLWATRAYYRYEKDSRRVREIQEYRARQQRLPRGPEDDEDWLDGLGRR